MNSINEVKVAGKTAIHRAKAALPIRKLIADGEIRDHWLILHHGCGKDQAGTRLLNEQTVCYKVREYDPNHVPNPDVLNSTYNCVIQNYVLNVLTPDARHGCMRQVAKLTSSDGCAFLSVRGCGDKSIKGDRLYDGVTTSTGTFQKGFTAQELRDLCNEYFEVVHILYGDTNNPSSITAYCQYPI